MAKRSSERYIDVDSTTLRPSPQRIRNILTLEERVAAIRAYDCRPMYTKVAKMFNCSWEQIKNIVANRNAILEFYEATKRAEFQSNPQVDDMRQQKINFLGECVYEYIQRVQFHTKIDITKDLIRSKAFEFRETMRIDNFVPNKAWVNHFKATYNFSLSNRQITLTRTPPASLDLRDIMTYCTKTKLQKKAPAAKKIQPPTKNLYRTSTKMALNHENDATVEELRQRRQRKVNFLERALLEYATRAKFHMKVSLDDDLLCRTAKTLAEMLKVDNFHATNMWLKSFKSRYDFDTIVRSNLATSTRTPPLSLDLKDILSYCSRLEKNSQIGLADTIRSHMNDFMDPLGAIQAQSPSLASLASPALASLAPSSATMTIRPMISVIPNASLMPNMTISNNPIIHKPLNEFKHEIINLDEDDDDVDDEEEDDDDDDNDNDNDDDDGDADDGALNDYRNVEEYEKPHDLLATSNGQMKRERSQEQDDERNKSKEIEENGEEKQNCPIPSLKIRKIESMCGKPDAIVPLSPGHWSMKSDRNNEEVIPKVVRNYADALKLLKPLEEFAMLEENYRAIGLLEQLESIFKNPPNKADDED